jgi:hypothetical protein
MSRVEIEVKSAVESSIRLLETARQPESRGRIEAILWNAAAELEYAAALISITHGLEDFDPLAGQKKSRAKSVPDTIGRGLILLNETLHGLDSDVRSSYTSLRKCLRLIRSL